MPTIRPARLWRLNVAVLVLAVAACTESGSAGGRLEATWTGSDTGWIRVPARALWCPAAGILEITAIGTDSGVGIVVRPAAGLAAGKYPVFDAVAHQIGRPGAAVAVRWFATGAIHAFRGDSGVVSLDRAEGTVSGQVEARMRGALEAGRLDFRARLRGVPIDTGAVLCPRDSTSHDTTRGVP
jgi:hypothetical protein